jgi:hypothetical protein
METRISDGGEVDSWIDLKTAEGARRVQSLKASSQKDDRKLS